MGDKHEEGVDSRNRTEKGGEEGENWEGKIIFKNLHFSIFFF